MTEQTGIADRQAIPSLDPDERPVSSGRRWAILIGFAVVALGAAASVNHGSDKADAPPAASAAQAPAPGSTNAVLPQTAPAAKSGG
ncbi:MAG TPA: hypothetical protein VNM46_06980 [Xanthobacteraceae bacterium]|jgi:hypothetical protein|nr:hypothetical protein [Xanthobacteraceae bacterium]